MPTPSFVRALALLSLAAGLASPRLLAEQPLPQPPLWLFERPLDEGWRFSLGENPGAQEPGYDDSGWRRVDLPHDWSIEARPGVPFHDPNTPDGVSVGYLHGGTGWYRKHFTVQKADAGREFEVVFDGVQQDADVWINGSYLGFQPHGYIGFHYALSGHLNPPGADNVIVVRALDPESNTRWYAGSGLYRDVSLRVSDPLHISVWGARIDTVWLFEGTALLQLGLDVQNDRATPEDTQIELSLTDPDGAVTQHSLGVLHLAPGASERFNSSLEVKPAVVWSVETPKLYEAEFRILQKGRLIHSYRQAFGIRTISVSAETGLLLNGKPVKLRGGCMHQDNGLLGAAAFADAEYRRVALMKRNGFNAIRTSHNPPSSAFLDACDRLGMLVVDEFADAWEIPKKPNGYQRYFDAHWEKDLGSMIARDFNHPSVVIWSIGNEIPERANRTGVEIGRRLAALVHHSDPRRPVTNAICGFYDDPELKGQWDPTAPAMALLDIGGYNYLWSNYEGDHQKYPSRVMMGTESFPRAALENWNAVERSTYVIGDFVWTGMDYIGESGIGHSLYWDLAKDATPAVPEWGQTPWPWWISWCGDIDITGLKKPQSRYRDVVWGLSQIEMAVHEPVPAGKYEAVGLWGWPLEFPSWTWPGAEGRELSVNVYSRAERVRLELNGRVVGEAAVDAAKGITATFKVPYESGVLTASALSGGRVVAKTELATTGPASAIRLLPEAAQIRASRAALAYVPVEIVDAKGACVPNASVPLSLTVEGPAELMAFGTGDPRDVSPLGTTSARSFNGRALVILRSTGEPGRVRVAVSGPGLAGGSADIAAVAPAAIP